MDCNIIRAGVLDWSVCIGILIRKPIVHNNIHQLFKLKRIKLTKFNAHVHVDDLIINY